MEKFLKSYVKMMAESREQKLSRDDIQEIVEDLMNNDEMWDTFDSFICDTLDSYED